MRTNERQTNQDVIRNPGATLSAPTWPPEKSQQDKLSRPRPRREPHFNDGDLLHGDGP